MCDPVTLGFILTASGAGAKAINQNMALRAQDREIARGIREQGRIQQKANQRLDQEIQDFSGSTGERERAEALAGFQQALRAADEEAVGGLPSIPGASQRFAEAVSQGAANIREGAGERAGRFARIDAPVLQREREAAGRADVALDFSELGRRSDAENFIAKLRASEEQPNEFINALAAIAQGAGSALALGGGLPNFLKGGPDLAKLAAKGTLVDAPVRANPFIGTPV